MARWVDVEGSFTTSDGVKVPVRIRVTPETTTRLGDNLISWDEVVQLVVEARTVTFRRFVCDAPLKWYGYAYGIASEVWLTRE